jgi:hypothetical protein
MSGDGYQILSLDEVEPTPYNDSNLIPVRYLLGYRAAGVNAWRADAGGQLIPPHAEDSGNEELYVVVLGRATFTVGGETSEAPAGSLVFVPPEVMRTAVAAEDGTIVLAVGATVGQPFRGGAWDTFAVANGLRQTGRMDECRTVMAKAMQDWPDSWALPYNAACLEALSGNADAAIAMLHRALELNRTEIHDYLREDSDLDNVRDDPRFQELLA